MSGVGGLVRQNLRRNRRHNLLSSIGVVVGIAAFTFFLGLDGGVRAVLLGKVFPADRIEVVPRKTTLLGSAVQIDDEALEKLRKGAGQVKPKNVYGKMALAFPSRGWGGKRIFGQDRAFEVSGFGDGIDSRSVDSTKSAYPFKDWLAEEKPKKCESGQKCPKGYYCAWDLYQCHRPVPALISPHLLELYNTRIAPAHPNLPKVPAFLGSMFAGITFTLELGRSMLGTTASRGGKPVQRKVQLVGVSDKAIPLGLTFPLGYVRRWNKRYGQEGLDKFYTSAVVVASDKAHITPLAEHARSLGFDIAESAAEQVGIFITLATLLFALVSVIIIAISAINIAHTFMMLVADRRREIGVLRAVGASKTDIRTMIVAEAAIIGAISGVIGVALAYGAARICNWASATYAPDFPYKPDSYFVFTPGLIAASLGFAVLFCVVGALLPARRAVAIEPAEALSSH